MAQSSADELTLQLRDLSFNGGRTWWAHFEFTRINTTPTILYKKIEDLRIVCAFFDFCGAESLWKAPDVSDGDRVRERPHAVEKGSMPTIERDDSAVYTGNDDDEGAD